MRAMPVETTARQILVVDDDADLCEQIGQYLSDNGFEVRTASDGRAMDEALAAAPIDLVVLDLMLPGEDGLSICRRLSDSGGPAVIMLSAMGDEVDRVLGLELGADDYLPKSTSPRELIARVRAVLRRRNDARDVGLRKNPSYHFQGFVLDTVRRQLRAPNDTVLLLSAGEFSLLRVFLEHPKRILSRDELLDLSRGGDAEVFDRAIDVQISRLRRKLNSPGGEELIKTFRNVGYLFDGSVTLA